MNTVTRIYKDTPTNRKLGRVGQSYQKPLPPPPTRETICKALETKRTKGKVKNIKVDCEGYMTVPYVENRPKDYRSPNLKAVVEKQRKMGIPKKDGNAVYFSGRGVPMYQSGVPPLSYQQSVKVGSGVYPRYGFGMVRY